ncbi:hypothetical protein BD779DRAFT_1468726 [Infundibulicybe gibba]|nr:hypothetical protein BD779DRAFT_1468726 [Infundibulicybe gibba]
MASKTTLVPWYPIVPQLILDPLFHSDSKFVGDKFRTSDGARYNFFTAELETGVFRLDPDHPLHRILLRPPPDEQLEMGVEWLRGNKYFHYADGDCRERWLRIRAVMREVDAVVDFAKIFRAISHHCIEDPVRRFEWQALPVTKLKVTQCGGPDCHDLLPPIAAMLPPDSEFAAPTGSLDEIWSRVHIPVAIGFEESRVFIKLFKFMRMTLRKQPNRRFLYGLAVNLESIIYCRVDRSSILTGDPVFYRSTPGGLITLINNLHKLSDLEHGWDPTLERSSLPSLFPSVPIWEASLQTKRAAEPEKFVLYSQVAVSSAKIAAMSTVRIWKAWRKSDLVKPIHERQVYVVKDCWQDDRFHPEGVIWRAIGHGDGLARFCSGRLIEINATSDITFDPSSLIGATVLPADQLWHAFLPTYTDGQALTSDLAAQIRRRRHYRMLMKSYGYSLDSFGSLTELVGALHDVVSSLSNLHNQNYLHGDISDGNVLVTGRPRPNRGILIDMELAFDLGQEQDPDNDNLHLRGTDAFLSCEVLAEHRRFVFSKRARSPGNSGRESIHELESIFWVLCYLCIIRVAPGACPDLSMDTPTGRLFKELFNGERAEMAIVRRGIIEHECDLWNNVLEYVSEYTAPLKPLIMDLHAILRLGYMERELARERKKKKHTETETETAVSEFKLNLHEKFLAALDEAENRLEANPPEDSARVRKQAANLRKMKEYDASFDPIDYTQLELSDSGEWEIKKITAMSRGQPKRKRARRA